LKTATWKYNETLQLTHLQLNTEPATPVPKYKNQTNLGNTLNCNQNRQTQESENSDYDSRNENQITATLTLCRNILKEHSYTKLFWQTKQATAPATLKPTNH
jgi:hypothetical protein